MTGAVPDPAVHSTAETPHAIDVRTLAEWLRQEKPLTIVDVREPWELEICKLNGTFDIPLRLLPDREVEIPRDRPAVFLCHHGIRSAQAVAWLRRAGFDRTINLEGGIDAWARVIDPTMVTY